MLHLNYDQEEKKPGFVVSNGLTKIRADTGQYHYTPMRELEAACGRHVEVGDHTIIEMPVRIGNNVKIGDYCKIPAGSNIPDNTIVEDGAIWQG